MIKSLENFKLYYEDLPDYPGIKTRVKILRLKRTLNKRKRAKS